MIPDVSDILRSAVTIAVVGISDKPDRDSYRIADYLRKHGYRVLPVNPNHAQVLGRKCYSSLREITEHVDVVDVFRKSEAVPEVVDDAIAIEAGTLWLQEGVSHPEAEQRARDAGLHVVTSRCIRSVHSALFGRATR
jgi:uncharacterized protein